MVRSHCLSVVICLDRFDAIYSQHPDLARTVLDILTEHHRYEILVGNRLTTIIQTENPSLEHSIGRIGGYIPNWNSKERMTIKREK